ncbi:hypothetical protein TNCV_4787651 [Trichonephila clavipes]|nr:hypothetical protein TNCV_4787651 [Trichonephila clavipes]
MELQTERPRFDARTTKCPQVHTDYVLVKSVGPKVLWAESRVQGTGENSPPLQFHVPKLWRLRPTADVHLAHCHDEFCGPRSDYVRKTNKPRNIPFNTRNNLVYSPSTLKTNFHLFPPRTIDEDIPNSKFSTSPSQADQKANVIPTPPPSFSIPILLFSPSVKIDGLNTGFLLEGTTVTTTRGRCTPAHKRTANLQFN